MKFGNPLVGYLVLNKNFYQRVRFMSMITDCRSESTGKILSKESPKDKAWETHRMTDDVIQNVFLNSADKKQIRRGERMCECAPYLIFKLVQDPKSEELKHRLRYAHFCHVRLCSQCMWRKSLSWRARFYQAWPAIQAKYRTARYFHMVLTVPNCSIFNLRETIKKINEAWNRMVARKTWPALGFLRSLEVTRDRLGGAHPHVHALMMVSPNYFSRNYMNREDWRVYWAKALKVPTESIIHPFVRAIKGGDEGVSKAVLEIVKYAVKAKTMKPMLKTKPGQAWFLELDNQLSGTKAVTLGGEIKRFMNDDEITEKEMLQQDREETQKIIMDVRYDWFKSEGHYIQTKVLSEVETLFWNRQEQKMRQKRL